MEPHNLIAWLIIGAISGWLAGQFVKGSGFGLLLDIVIGIAGAIVGGWLSGLLGISAGPGWIASIIIATLGAAILLLLARLVKRA